MDTHAGGFSSALFKFGTHCDNESLGSTMLLGSRNRTSCKHGHASARAEFSGSKIRLCLSSVVLRVVRYIPNTKEEKMKVDRIPMAKEEIVHYLLREVGKHDR